MDSPRDFEAWLHHAAQQFAYPSAPSLSGRVAARLREGQLRQRSRLELVQYRFVPRSPATRRAAVALLLVAVIIGVAVGAFPPVRTTLAEFFSLQRIEVTPVESPPVAPPASDSPSGWDRVAGATTLTEARRKAGFPLRLPDHPEGLDGPDAVYFQDLQPGQQVILVYLAPPNLELPDSDSGYIRFTLFQFKTEGIFLKQVFPETLVEEVEVSGNRALWFQGAAHYLQYRDADGDVGTEVRRLVTGNTLAWEVGDITYRLETSLPKGEAIKIAESLR